MAPRHGGEDWRRSLRNATFRGAHFWVETESADGGRRIVVHEFPHSEIPYCEDMGQQVRRYQVSAYVAGGEASGQAKAFFEACTAIGPATLVLPMAGTIFAKCIDVAIDRIKDKHGFVAFRASFVTEGLSYSSLAGSPHYASRIKTKSADAAPIISQSFSRTYRGVGIARFVVDSAIATTSAYVDAWLTIVAQSGMRGTKSAEMTKLLLDFDEAMPDMLESGYVGNKYAADAYWASEIAVSSEPFTSSVQGIAKHFRETAEPALAVDGFQTLLGFGDELQPIPSTTLNRKHEQTNQDSLLALFRRSALVELAVAVTNLEFTSRRDAIAIRAFVAQRFDDELRLIRSGDNWEVLGAITELQGLTIEFLSKLIADLAPVLQIEARTMLPAQYWAYRLYKDAMRGDEISARNKTKHPAFMPATFEALSK